MANGADVVPAALQACSPPAELQAGFFVAESRAVVPPADAADADTPDANESLANAADANETFDANESPADADDADMSNEPPGDAVDDANLPIAEVWGDRGSIFTEEDVVMAANLTDADGAKIKLTLRASQWTVLSRLSPETWPSDDNVPVDHYFKKIPSHVIAAPSWNCALTNMYEFSLGSVDEKKKRGIEI